MYSDTINVKNNTTMKELKDDALAVKRAKAAEYNRRAEAEEAFASKVKSEKKITVTVAGEDWSLTLGQRHGSAVAALIAEQHRNLAEGYRSKANDLRL